MRKDHVQAELDRTPFIPFRLHLVSGRTVDILTAQSGWMLRNAILVLQDRSRTSGESGYNVLSLRNIEMLEQLVLGRAARP